MAKRILLFLIFLAVLPSLAWAAESTDTVPVSISAQADTLTPYENEPVLYTVRIVSRAGLSDVTLGDLAVVNAIVTSQGEPAAHVATVNGTPQRVVEFHFIITPMQAGHITIPPVMLQGNILADDRQSAEDPFGGNFMAGVRQVMKALSNFTNGRPFHVASNVTSLDVKPAAVAMDPWLPLKSLKIAEEADATQQPQVGEPMIRKITLSAVDAVASQLPDVEAQQDHDNFKVYADKPVLKTDIDKETGALIAQRVESYSLVPQRAGRLVLPAIRISWWDTVNNRVATATLPSRAVTVQPGLPVRNPAVLDVDATGVSADTPAPARWAQNLLAKARLLLPYGTAIALVGLIILGGFAAARRLWPMRRGWLAKGNPANSNADVARPLSPHALKQVHTAEQLSVFLRAYAQQQWGAPKNATLESVLPQLAASPDDRQDADIIVAALAGALYAGKVVDVEDLKKRTRRVLASLKHRPRARRRDGTKLPGLNPS